MTKRRAFIRTLTAGSAGIALGGVATGMTPVSYSRIIGANDRINIAIMGLGNRYTSFAPCIAAKENNIGLLYLCDVMQSQREKALGTLSKLIDYKPVLENDIRKILADQKVDAIFNAGPDHWHTPGACMAMKSGKHVYVEKPCSHNPYETELLVAHQHKYNKVVQMGTQYRSVPHIREIVKEVQNGLIGKTFKGISFLSSNRLDVPVPVKSPVPDGLDWDLFQGPAPRTGYSDNTWNYNWHWYGWAYGTGEAGNNAIHELDIARWAMQLELPEHVEVDAAKRYYLKDGWTMYDTMEATYKFSENRLLKWDGKSRNGYPTYGINRGSIIFGTEGTVFIDAFCYKVFDKSGKMLREKRRPEKVDDGTTAHMMNFFNAIRGKEQLNAPVEIATISNLYSNYANIAYRIGSSFDVDTTTGYIYNREAMKLWSREYEPGWEPKID